MPFRRLLAERPGFTRRLGFRLAALLSVAVLPIGLISLVQNLRLSQEAERSAEIAILGRTASAAAGERALLQSALGSADALGPAVLDAIDRPQQCADLMENFIERSATYVFAGFVPLNGLSTCNSFIEPGQILDLRETREFQRFVARPGTIVTTANDAPGSDRAIVLLMHPLYRDRDLLGYTTVALTHELLRSTHSLNFGTEGARIVTFNHLGEILTSDSGADGEATDILPQHADLISLLSRIETTFHDRANTGEERVFTVVTVVPGLVYALGSWSPKTASPGILQLSRFWAVLFPIALWAASIAVAYFAVFRLVLRHINELRGQMRRFAIGSRNLPPPVLIGAPTEIADVSITFHNMVRILIRDEEAMAAAVAEKTVLLKELHHRVKNNLQLIASIINMQSRVVEDNDAKHVLHSVQDRVAALATIYRNLYQAEHLDAVGADSLLGEIIDKMLNVSALPDSDLRIETRLDPLILLPDQAVPLSLLATEAFTNAVKYVGRPQGDRPWIKVSLSRGEGRAALFEIVNSVDGSSNQAEGTGLGSQLIEAFATQLEGSITTGIEENSFFLRLNFVIQPASPHSHHSLGSQILASGESDPAKL